MFQDFSPQSHRGIRIEVTAYRGIGVYPSLGGRGTQGEGVIFGGFCINV